MQITREKVLAFAGYNLFFWGSFWAFFYWTFPYDRLASFISDRIATSGSGYSVEIGQLSPHWLTGVALEDVKVRKMQAPSTLAAPDAEAKKNEPLRIQEASARFGLLSFLTGGTSVSFSAALEQGSIEGEYAESDEERHIDATIVKLDIAKLGLFESLISLPAQGTMEGDFDLTLGKDPTKTNGNVKITLRGFTIGDGQAKVKLGTMGGLTVDPVNAGDVTLELDVKAGVGQVKRLTADGSDVELLGSGDVRFANPVDRSRIDILLKIKFTDAYKNKSGRTKAMFSLLESAGASQLKAAMTSDGGLAYRLSGSLAALRAIPAAKSFDKAGPVPAVVAPQTDDDDAE